MRSISLQFTQKLAQQLNQLPIRSNRYKVALYAPVGLAQQDPTYQLTEVSSEKTEFAFHVMFERNNPESAWRLVTPLKFTD